MLKRNICVVTGSRAEYGLLYWLMRSIDDSDDLNLQLIVTGMHLSTEFGLTYKQIEKDGFKICRKIEMLLSSDTPVGISKSIGLGTLAFGEAYEALRPDIVVLLGDRFEIFSAASVALTLTIPIAHIHGGETTLGAIDEALRHSITKMSHLHFTATELYRRRVVQLGENPDRVFNFGALGVENVRRLKLLDRTELQRSLGRDLGPRSLLVTWHPVTLEPGKSKIYFQTLLKALDELQGVMLIFTKANADAEGRLVNQMIDSYVSNYPDKAAAYMSLGQLLYLSTLKNVDGVIGNSSSGLIEAPSVKTGTINIGERQGGRVRATSVIDCEPNLESIRDALQRLFSDEFLVNLKNVENPHGEGHVSAKILDKLRETPLKNILKKKFFDVESINDEL